MVAEISPLLKFVLELGPLMVFFFANSRGEWLASTFPVLTEFGGPIFIATGLFMIRDRRRFDRVLDFDAEVADHAADIRHRRLCVRRADVVVAERLPSSR